MRNDRSMQSRNFGNYSCSIKLLTCKIDICYTSSVIFISIYIYIYVPSINAYVCVCWCVGKRDIMLKMHFCETWLPLWYSKSDYIVIASISRYIVTFILERELQAMKYFLCVGSLHMTALYGKMMSQAMFYILCCEFDPMNQWNSHMLISNKLENSRRKYDQSRNSDF